MIPKIAKKLDFSSSNITSKAKSLVSLILSFCVTIKSSHLIHQASIVLWQLFFHTMVQHHNEEGGRGLKVVEPYMLLIFSLTSFHTREREVVRRELLRESQQKANKLPPTPFCEDKAEEINLTQTHRLIAFFCNPQLSPQMKIIN